MIVKTYLLLVSGMTSPQESDYEFGSCYSSLGRFPATSTSSSVCGLLPSPPPLPPPQKRHPLSPTGGLSDLSGMLAEKMSFGNGVDVLSRRRNVNGDDAQSRDSGKL